MLKSVEEKIKFSLSLSNRLMGTVNDPEGLWYHSIGMLNAFYAICEELKNVKGNNLDSILSPIVITWLIDNGDKMRELFLGARNKATHAGRVKVDGGIDWILSHQHNTEFPENYAVITISGTHFENMRSDEFFKKCYEVFMFLLDGLFEIERQYQAQGGTAELMQKVEVIDDKWGDLILE